jgi:lipid-A-disaccharide synthase
LDILILAGEASGDLHAAGLLREFRRLHPETRFFGTGGDRMAAQGCELIYHVKDISFMGFAEVIRHLPFIRRMMRTLLNECRRRRPAAVVLVDYPGFNLRFAARLRRLPEMARTPILYYISPQVWAWHSSRIPQIARLVDRMAVIFDFEAPLYQAAGLRADFVGHPLLEVVEPSLNKAAFLHDLGLEGAGPLLALAPGSRRQEVHRLLPLFLQTAARLRRDFPNLKALVGCSPTLDPVVYRDLKVAAGGGEEILLLSNRTYDLLAHSDAVLAASGTVTLETALLGTPLVVAYKMTPSTYWIARRLVKIPHISLVNVVAGRRVVREFIQDHATPQALAAELAPLLTDTERRRIMLDDLAQVKARLGPGGASAKVARILQSMIKAGSERV